MAQKPFSSLHELTAADVNTLVGTYQRVTAALEVVNTLTETTVLDVTVGAGHLSTDRMLRVTLLGDYLHTTGGTTELTTRIKFGGSTIFGHALGGINPDADRYPFRLEFKLANLGATNVQFLSGWQNGFAASTAGSVAGLYSIPSSVEFFSAGTTAIDTTSAQTLQVTIQHASALSTISFRRHYAIVELL